MPATNAIGCLAIAAAVTGASAVVAKSAPPPSTVSRHCLPEVKLATEMSRPCLRTCPCLGDDGEPRYRPEFGRRAFSNSSAVAHSGVANRKDADRTNAAKRRAVVDRMPNPASAVIGVIDRDERVV